MSSGARLIGLVGPRRARPGARAAVYAPSLGCLVFAAAALGCSRQGASPVVAEQSAALTAGPCSAGAPCAFVMVTPVALTPAALVLSATTSLKIDDRVTVKESSGSPAVIANLGTGPTQVGTDGKLGDIWSLGPVTLGDRTAVNGTIHGAVKITTGTNVTIKAKDTKTFQTVTTGGTVTFPIGAPPVDLEPGVTAQLPPGSYGAVAVKARAVLNVGAGSYLMDSLDLEPTCTLALDTTGGPIRLFVRSTIILRGNITSTTDARDFSLFYFGSQLLSVEAPLNATVVAPLATINVTTVSPLTGAYFGKSIEVFSGDTITHVSPRAPLVNTRSGRIEAESADAISGGKVDGTVVDQLGGGSWLLYRGVDFGTPGKFNRVSFDVLSATGVDEIVMHVDSLTGPVAADLHTLQTGTGGFIPESTTLSPAVTGVHDTYIVFNGSEADGLDWFQLTTGPTRQVTVTAGPAPSPDAGAPDADRLPGEDQEDIPANVNWVTMPKDIAISAHKSDGFAISLTKPAAVFIQLKWKNGTAVPTASLSDTSGNLIAPVRSHTFTGDKALVTLSPPLPVGTFNVVITNNDNGTILASTVVGAAPTP